MPTSPAPPASAAPEAPLSRDRFLSQAVLPSPKALAATASRGLRASEGAHGLCPDHRNVRMTVTGTVDCYDDCVKGSGRYRSQI